MKTSIAHRMGAGAVLLVLTLIVVGAIVVSHPSGTSTANTPRTAAPTAAIATNYKDGTYTADGSYASPGGMESITVTLVVQGNAVSDATVVSGANDPTASSYQSIFISGYKPYVVGKKLNEISISNVSGSSLTSKGFTDALKHIETQAKA